MGVQNKAGFFSPAMDLDASRRAANIRRARSYSRLRVRLTANHFENLLQLGEGPSRGQDLIFRRFKTFIPLPRRFPYNLLTYDTVFYVLFASSLCRRE